ncbi:hypothetical protein [Stieleria mannarensis]|uniref:hypothetical protein n=1 Tax=Stieleria mannarensis TaxID=2755585 RepID=UPI0016017B6E|nr:hypothetical protein [Rhodopirellula sp. JC639]
MFHSVRRQPTRRFKTAFSRLLSSIVVACFLVIGGQDAQGYELWLYNNTGTDLLPYPVQIQPDGRQQRVPDPASELPDGYAELIDTGGYNPIYADDASHRHVIIQIGKETVPEILAIVFRHRVAIGEEGKDPDRVPEELRRFTFPVSTTEPNWLILESDWTIRHEVGDLADDDEGAADPVGEPTAAETAAATAPTVDPPPPPTSTQRRGIEARRGDRRTILPLPGAAARRAKTDRTADGQSNRILLLDSTPQHQLWTTPTTQWIESYNRARAARYSIASMTFTTTSKTVRGETPGFVWNLSVRQPGPIGSWEEQSLESLASQYDLIVLKHSPAIRQVNVDARKGEIASPLKSLQNHQLQYDTIKKRLRQHPETRFVIWTGPAPSRRRVNRDAALRANEFFRWVRDDWDQPGDNVFIWDCYAIGSRDGLYLDAEFESDERTPNATYFRTVTPMLGQRIVDVLQGRGDIAAVTGGEIDKLSPQPEPPDLPTMRRVPRIRIRPR